MLKICFSSIPFPVFHSRTREKGSQDIPGKALRRFCPPSWFVTHMFCTVLRQKKKMHGRKFSYHKAHLGPQKNAPLNFCNADGKAAGLWILFILVTHGKQELWLRSPAVVSSLHSLHWPIPLVCWRIPAWGSFSVISFTCYTETGDKIICLCDKTMFVG